jgi:Toprim domain
MTVHPRDGARDLAYQLSLRADHVARRLLGKPNRKATGRSKRELRFNSHGSLRVRIAGPRCGKWNDYETGQHGDLLDLIRREQGCTFGVACDYAREMLGIRQESGTKPKAALRPTPKHEPTPEPKDDAERIQRALRVWREAGPIIGTPGAIYLAKRGIDLDAVPDLHDVLRWHPRCPWGEGGATHPCLVALWTNIHSVAPQAIHRRPISGSGEKLDHWKALGPYWGCCIRLWSDEHVEQGLVLGEGPETVLAAATRIEHRGTLLRPAWAAGDAGHMRDFPVLSGIEALTLLVDHDPLAPKAGNYPGQDAAAECARRWTAAGREVIRLVPRIVGADFNDIATGEIAS